MVNKEAPEPAGGPKARPLAQGRGWRLSEYVCQAGPEDSAFEEQHACVTIAAVASGTFKYRADTGTAILHPGGFLLGNVDRCYECGHEHSRGDRCIALHLDPQYFEEIASNAVRKSGYRFPIAMIPAMTGSLPQASYLESLAQSRETMLTDQSVPFLAEAVIGIVSGLKPMRIHPSARDEKRIGEVLRYMEQHVQEELDIDSLAAHACMSKFHFLRVFRKVVGMAPYQFLLNMRLRKVAVRLATSAASVAHIALEEGFGDLSTFNRRFRQVFGLTPKKFRKAGLI